MTTKKPIEQRDFTRAELSKFQGEGGAPIYVGIKGRVFDVSAGKDFYGPGSGYACFAGRDATVGLASGSLKLEEWADRDVASLSPGEEESLASWESFFEGKYDVVGRIVD